jgi:hypothetical protein
MLQDSSRLARIAQQAHDLPRIVQALGSSQQFCDPIFPAAPAAIGSSSSKEGRRLAERVSSWVPVHVLAAANGAKSGLELSGGLLYSVSKLAATDVVQVLSPLLLLLPPLHALAPLAPPSNMSRT